MSLPHEKSSARPTLEDLLRLKRSERPSPAFWDEFDRGLREKQLAALVQQPRGWARLRPLLFRTMRWSVPATAAAVATFGVVRHFTVAPVAPMVANAVPTVVQVSAPAPVRNEVRPVSEPAPMVASVTESPAFEPAAPIVRHREIPSTVIAASMPSVPVREVASYERLQPANLSRPAANNQFFRSDSAGLTQSAGFVPVSFGTANSLGDQVAQVSARESTNGPVGSWGDYDSRLMQVTALDLRVTNDHAANLPSTPANYSAQNHSRVRLPEEEREYRDISRFGVQGSSLSIRF